MSPFLAMSSASALEMSSTRAPVSMAVEVATLFTSAARYEAALRRWGLVRARDFLDMGLF